MHQADTNSQSGVKAVPCWAYRLAGGLRLACGLGPDSRARDGELGLPLVNWTFVRKNKPEMSKKNQKLHLKPHLKKNNITVGEECHKLPYIT